MVLDNWYFSKYLQNNKTLSLLPWKWGFFATKTCLLLDSSWYLSILSGQYLGLFVQCLTNIDCCIQLWKVLLSKWNTLHGWMLDYINIWQWSWRTYQNSILYFNLAMMRGKSHTLKEDSFQVSHLDIFQFYQVWHFVIETIYNVITCMSLFCK